MTGSPAGLSTLWVDVVDVSLLWLRALPSTCGTTTSIGRSPPTASTGLGAGVGTMRLSPPSKDQVLSGPAPLPISISMTSPLSP
ncbi:hypothetical protein HETIRDRAFT_433459 [Heterobasidion irregulare TC 32-1]|uniref:Uncharacterized protein n=1 Tax=Heterobasidion irregulare (strain TC 32-1) TaxID=747525 RepID=W4KHN7_HETIT|nr:uncharacterized protein HETIRDRAFT_433459 [Heterobasidion irregulare TC 32-1]ETW84815.1 hypothetical protein HETIRDRAFT_433459 [Heterobasidion irregulare TC 32-1]